VGQCRSGQGKGMRRNGAREGDDAKGTRGRVTCEKGKKGEETRGRASRKKRRNKYGGKGGREERRKWWGRGEGVRS